MQAKWSQSAGCHRFALIDNMQVKNKVIRLGTVGERFVYEGNKVSACLLTHSTDSGKHVWLSMEQNLRTLSTRLEKLEERFAFGEDRREIFEKVGGKKSNL